MNSALPECPGLERCAAAGYNGRGDTVELHVKGFDGLTNAELYEILKLRVDVFVAEQRCAYPDLDGRDYAALHVFYEEGGEILAYLRVLPAGSMFPDAAGIGRVIAKRRGEGLGARVLAAGIAAARRSFGAGKIKLEAQCYAAGFYEKAGFVRRGEPFDEDGIEHVLMELET